MTLYESNQNEINLFHSNLNKYFNLKEEFNGTLSSFVNLRPAPQVEDGIGHVYVQGMLISGGTEYEKLFATDYGDIRSELESVIVQGAGGIVLHVDSGGGTVQGAIECAEFIESLPVPVVAYTSGLACSAAYKLAAASTAIVATKSATVGNIGSLCVLVDDSAMMERVGIKVIALASEGADLKTTGYGFTESQLEFLQESINESGSSFKEFVLRSRPEVAEEVFRAGWFSGAKAYDLGLIDEIGNEETAIGNAKFLASLTLSI